MVCGVFVFIDKFLGKIFILMNCHPGLHQRPGGDHAAEAVHRAVPAARPGARDGKHLRELQDLLRERQRAVRGHEEAPQHRGAAGRPRRSRLRLEAGHGVAL